MGQHFDVAILGMGPGGEVAASQLLKAGKKVAVIKRELIGGECAYWACVPSKTLLRPPEARTAATRAAGVTGAGLEWAATSDYRDYMIRHLDDKAQVDGYAGQGATVIKAEATITRGAPRRGTGTALPRRGRCGCAARQPRCPRPARGEQQCA